MTSCRLAVVEATKNAERGMTAHLFNKVVAAKRSHFMELRQAKLHEQDGELMR